MAASATVTESRAWIIDPDNPTVQIVSGTAGGVGGGGQRITQKTRSGSVRSYGSGRVRAVAGASTVTTYSLAMIRLTVAQAAQLDAWRDAGTVLLFRDTYGQKSFGVIFATSQYYELLSGGYSDVGVIFNEVTLPDGS